MEKYFDERIGMQMFESDDQRDLMRIFVEARNINVHNGGIINEVFLARVGTVKDYKFMTGKRFHIDMENLMVLSENAMRLAINIDEVVSKKFGLKRQSHQVWIR